MKECTRCKETKNENCFPKSSRDKTKTYNQCIICRRKLIKTHYENNKNDYYERVKLRREDFCRYLNELKSNPCTDCGRSYGFWVMHYDHLDPDKKLMDVSGFKGRSCNIKKLLQEISKCELVCANCHADRTYKRIVAKKGNTNVTSNSSL
jgi:hypothetical protein